MWWAKPSPVKRPRPLLPRRHGGGPVGRPPAPFRSRRSWPARAAKLRCAGEDGLCLSDSRPKTRDVEMKKLISVVAAGALGLSVTACNTPGERAAGGAVL